MTNVSLTLAEALDRAFSAYRAGKLIEAERLCLKITAAKHDFFDAFHLLAFVQSNLGKKDKALGNYDRAITLRPNHAEALNNRGNVLHELKRFAEALVSYDRALDAQPEYAEAFNNRGNTLLELRRFDEALASYERAIAARPHYAEALNNRGNALQELKRFDEALLSFERALAVRPDFAEALNNRGNALQELKRFDEALASYDRAIAARPDYAEALNNRGNALQQFKRFDEALASYDRAIAARPDYAEALSNRGVILKELKRLDEALLSYERALAVRPDFAEAHHNQALCLLLLGDFDRGWQKHEWRFQTDWMRTDKPSFSQPLWLGDENISGKTILLHAEQGYGDIIQFCRYVPMVAERGARVILQVPGNLRELMRTLPGTAQIVSNRDLPGFDVHCPLLSLPLAFGTRVETIPSVTPYLHPSSQAVSAWEKRLGPKRRPRVGFAWSGRPTHKNDRNRSMNLSALLPLFEIDATFLSLQKDIRAADAMTLKDHGDLVDLGGVLRDFSDTAALIATLDLVISVDTSVAHLAGALAKPVWVLLPFLPDWRWLLDRNDSPWYPTARLFRQDETRTWDDVITRVHAALSDFATKRETG